MNPWLGPALALAVAAGGCSSCPPMRAAWYRHELDDGAHLRIALVNEGRETAVLTRVTVNPEGDGAARGWSPARLRSLQPGEVKVLDLTDFPECRLPVALRLECAGRPQPAWVALDGKLPNYLPGDWARLCGLERLP